MESKKDTMRPFVREVAKYFMDFLETNFQKRKIPKRSIQTRNRKNLLVGTNLRNYPLFQQKILNHLATNNFEAAAFGIQSGQYTKGLSVSVKTAVSTAISKLDTEVYQGFLSQAGPKIIEGIEGESGDIEASRVHFVETLVQGLSVHYIGPTFSLVVNTLRGAYDFDETQLQSAESEIIAAILGDIDESTAEIVSELALGGSRERLETHIKCLISEDRIKQCLSEYFQSYQVKDLHEEIVELENSRKVQDKQSLYLYLFDVSYKKQTFPLFYTPLEVRSVRGGKEIVPDQNIYINKKAIEYINDDLNREQGRTGKITEIADRIIYAGNGGEVIADLLKPILRAISDKFLVTGELVPEESSHQRISGPEVTISNGLHLAVFDKSDEALINDYEEIIGFLDDEDNQIASDFVSLIQSFIDQDPRKITNEIESDWDKLPPNEKLIYKSPIPLNTEQRQILSALNNNKSRFITVQGPPGTGKSHTITAIVFEAILSNKSVLVLSDKKEALDVVETKITDTLNRVRTDDHFQNPILRLGKSGNSYSKILSPSGLNRIKTHHTAMKEHLPQLEKQISSTEAAVKNSLASVTNALTGISLKEIASIVQMEASGVLLPVAASEFEGHSEEEISSQFKRAQATIEGLGEIEQVPGGKWILETAKFLGGYSVDHLRASIKLLKRITDLGIGKSEAQLLLQFSEKSIGRLDQLSLLREEVRTIFWLGFGWLIRGRFQSLLDRAIKACLIEADASIEVLFRIDDYRALVSWIKDELGATDFLPVWRDLLSSGAAPPSSQLFDMLDSDLAALEDFCEKYVKTASKLVIDLESIETLQTSKLVGTSPDRIEATARYIYMVNQVEGQFFSLPEYSHFDSLKGLEGLYTAEMTHILDGRVLNFTETYGATAKTLAQIIRKKKRFPREEFSKLKAAFPCIIAGIRDFAEYIPLEIGCFDIVIIDEASQVSMAQALPAVVRGKKIVVLGDKRQFSNIKSAQARSATNVQYLGELMRAANKAGITEGSQLERASKFNIKTSVLDFFDFISNFNIMLKKHFRGYRELISYSSKYFYQDQRQAIKIRSKPISEVLRFTILEDDGKVELVENTNSLEIEAIKKVLQEIVADKDAKPASIGVITPHTNQQKRILDAINALECSDELFSRHKLKVMTFDTCQGEERDIILYSMVARRDSDKLQYIFASDVSSQDLDDEGKIKAQRLNVGFSRAKEQMHFFLSKPIEEYTGGALVALKHFHSVLQKASDVPLPTDVDQRSPMEKKVLDWIQETSFYKRNQEKISLVAQFPVGEYLKQLDTFYRHPNYVADFLLTYKSNKGRVLILIEYDGFKEHFVSRDEVNAWNYESYYKESDIVREKTLESYGYRFIRINRFNLGEDPVAELDKRLQALVREENQLGNETIIDLVKRVSAGLEKGTHKECFSCKKARPLEEFRDSSLVSGTGRKCRSCKGIGKRKARRRVSYSGKSRVTSAQKCPRCDSTMVERNGRYGVFLGCSRYPRCRGTRNIA